MAMASYSLAVRSVFALLGGNLGTRKPNMNIAIPVKRNVNIVVTRQSFQVEHEGLNMLDGPENESCRLAVGSMG